MNNGVSRAIFAPKSPTALIRGAIGTCFSNSAALFITAAVMLIPATVLTVAFGYVLGQYGAFELVQAIQKGQINPATIDAQELVGSVLLLAGGQMIVGVAGVLSSFAAAAAVGRMLAERAIGRPYSPADAWDFVIGKVPRLIGAGIVQGAILFIGYIIAAIPAGVAALIVLAATGGLRSGTVGSPLVQVVGSVVALVITAVVMTYVASMPAVVAVEDVGGISAVFRSFRLVSGQFWHAVGTVVVGGSLFLGLAFVGWGAVQTPLLGRLRDTFGPAGAMAAAYAIPALFGLIGSPMMFAVQALLYFDLRSRSADDVEFDLDELALELGAESPAGLQGLPERDSSGLSSDSDAPPDSSLG